VGNALRILLVDDEPLARYACRKLINEKFPGYKVVGEVSTGSEALKAFRALEPDIILMDIELPEINGLEASLLILKESPETQIIIVSAYERFGYAQEAINTGVLGYVVKPIQESSLRALMDHARQNISSSKKFSSSQEEFHLYRSLAIKDMVAAFMHGSYGGLTAEAFAHLLSQPISEGMFMVCSIRNSNAEDSLEEEQRFQIEQAVGRFPNCFAGHWIGAVLPIFVSTFLELTPKKYSHKDEQIRSFVREFTRSIQSKTGLTMRVCVGAWQTNPARFPRSFHQAFDLLQTNGSEAIQICRTVNDVPDSRSEDSKSGVFPDKIEAQLIQAIIHGKKEEAREGAVQFTRWLADNTNSVLSMKYTTLELLIQIRRNQTLRIHNRLQELIQSLIRVLDYFETSEEIYNWLPTAINHIVRITDESLSAEETNIQKILHYIDLNDLGTTVSLENVASFIGLTPQYISRLFKQHFNINFIDYVTQRRINLAADLLKTTDLPIKDVSSRCGYNDMSYFSKVFSKFIGLTPREYRQQAKLAESHSPLKGD